MTQVDNLIFDVSGMLYRTYYSAKNQPAKRAGLFEEDEEPFNLANFAMHTALNSMNATFKKIKPSRVFACFDRPNNWRKQYMSSDVAISVLEYKGNRRQNMSEAQQADYFAFVQHMGEFEQMLRAQTGIYTVAAEGLEADDCIAGCVQMLADEQNVIASNDTDMYQLITENTRVYGFTAGDIVTCKDPKFFLFEKIFRGDKSDNIVNIYPGIRTTKLQAAFDDPYALANIFAEAYIPPSDPTNTQFTIQDLFHENELLIDLSKQPPYIRRLIDKTINEQLTETKRFNFWKFCEFCKKHTLTDVLNNVQQYRPLLLGGYKYVR